MAKKVLLDCYISINGVDRSANVSKVELDDSFETKEKTTFGDGGAKTNLAGLEEGSISVTFKNDYATGQLDEAMWALRRSIVPFEVRPSQAAVGVNNPKYTGNILINGWKPIAGNVGDVAEVDIEFPLDGPMARATS
jgi:hypothetical protein